MSRKSRAIVSSAALMAASQAILSAHSGHDTLSIESSGTHFDRIATEAVATALGRDLVRRSQETIAQTIKIDDALLDEQYSQIAETRANGPFLKDSTNGGSAYFSCYSNCHSACHGSRGWR